MKNKLELFSHRIESQKRERKKDAKKEITKSTRR